MERARMILSAGQRKVRQMSAAVRAAEQWRRQRKDCGCAYRGSFFVHLVGERDFAHRVDKFLTFLRAWIRNEPVSTIMGARLRQAARRILPAARHAGKNLEHEQGKQWPRYTAKISTGGTRRERDPPSGSVDRRGKGVDVRTTPFLLLSLFERALA